MATEFPSARHQAALNTPTGYRRWSRFTFSRGGLTRELEPVSGSLTQDSRRKGRWDGRLTFAGDALIPRRPSDLLTPFGTRVEVELGLELLDGSVSSVPYGTYEISSARTRTEAGTRLVDVGLVDVSNIVERYRFEKPLTVLGGFDLADAINIVVTNRAGLSPQVSDTGVTLNAARPFGLDPETGPWSEIIDMLTGYSKTAWYNRVGHIEVGSVNPDPATAYPLDQLTSRSSDFDDRPPNVIVVRSEPQDGTAPIYAVAVDSDPSSPTYAGTGPGTSPYGRVTKYYSSPLIGKTPGLAIAIANLLLANVVGAGATSTMLRPYDPTVDAEDVVSVSGDNLAVDAVTVDLTGDTSIQVREL